MVHSSYTVARTCSQHGRPRLNRSSLAIMVIGSRSAVGLRHKPHALWSGSRTWTIQVLEARGPGRWGWGVERWWSGETMRGECWVPGTRCVRSAARSVGPFATQVHGTSRRVSCTNIRFLSVLGSLHAAQFSAPRVGPCVSGTFLLAMDVLGTHASTNVVTASESEAVTVVGFLNFDGGSLQAYDSFHPSSLFVMHADVSRANAHGSESCAPCTWV